MDTRYRGSLAAAASVAAVLSLAMPIVAESDAFRIANPEWFINMTAFGYADVAADVPGARSDPQYFREYLSGEWAAAIGYQDGDRSQVEWLEPDFVFPDWETNSSFEIASPFGFQDANNDRVPDFNADGMNIYTSRIENARFSVTQTFEFLNAGVGIAQGRHPRTADDPGSNVTSSQYVLKQTYRVMNRTNDPIRGVRLYQLLHGLHSTAAVFDDNNYDEPSTCGGVKCSEYRYDVSMTAHVRAFVDVDRPFVDVEGEPARATDVSDLFGFVPSINDAFLRSLLGKDAAAIEEAFRAIRVIPDADTINAIARSELYVRNIDIVSFHSDNAPIRIDAPKDAVEADGPFGWEIGRYGMHGTDNHIEGKPSTGVHLSIENAKLNGREVFRPAEKWVSGAQVFALGDLNPDATAVFDVLLSISTAQEVTEAPGRAGATRNPAPGDPSGRAILFRRPRP